MMDPSELLLSKENIQPLRHGRDTSKLCAGLQAQTDSDAERMLQKQRQEYETLLRDDAIADPLAVWYDYVNWLEQSYPSQSHKANINVVLKKCITKFKQNESYKNDERFVKLCLKYATMNDDTSDTFGLLYSHGIGVKCAIFYIAWAELFAMTDSYKKADRVYEKGINRLAQPIELLKEAQRKFQAFLVKKMLDKEETFQPSSEVYEAVPVRQAYNKLRPINAGNREIIPSVRVGENVAAPGKFPVASKPAVKINGPIAFYRDDDEAGEDVKLTAKIHKVKSHAAMTKENHKKAGVWTNPDKKNVPFAVPAAQLPFQVHVDDDTGGNPVKPNAPLSSALKPKQTSDEFNVDYANTPLFCSEPYDPSIRPMYRKEQVYAGGLEFQFEELRAIKYRRRMAESEKTMETPVASITKLYPSITTQSVPSQQPLPASSTKQSETVPLPEKFNTKESEFVAPVHPESMKKGAVKGLDFTNPQESVKKMAPSTLESEKKIGSKCLETQEPSSKPRVVYDSGRKSLKIRSGEEARSVRRKIATGGEELDRRGSHSSARKSAHSNFAGVVRRTLVLDPRDSSSLPKPDAPSDSFINQTIHTKEALNEMQALWFAKPATPPKRETKSAFAFFVDDSCVGKECAKPAADDLNAAPLVAPQGEAKPPFAFYVDESCLGKEATEANKLVSSVPPDSAQNAAKSAFPFYVDESCLGKEAAEPVETAREPLPLPRKTLTPLCLPPPPVLPHLFDDQNKENAIPIDYTGVSGRSTRPVTGILTPSENVPFQPIGEEDEEEGDEEQPEEEEDISVPEAPGNTTGITETWNFTQAFNFPKIIHASTPNVRRSVYRPPPPNELGSVTEPACGENEQPMDLKMTAPVGTGGKNSEDSAQKEQCDRFEVKKSQQIRAMASEQRTLGDGGGKNLSIIVETSREYKSSSSGSGVSACSKLLPFTPGESRTEAHLKRFYSYSQTEESRKTPCASKTQSTYGYEASAELSCTGPKPTHDHEASCPPPKLAQDYSKENEVQSFAPRTTLEDPNYENGLPSEDENCVGKEPNKNLRADRRRVADMAHHFESNSHVENVSDKEDKLYRRTGKNPSIKEKKEMQSHFTNDVETVTACLEQVQIHPQEDIDPFDEKLIDKFLEEMNFPTGVHVKGCHFMHCKLPPPKLSSRIALGNDQFDVKKVLGEGAYAKVFKVQNVRTGVVKVLKYQKPAFPWEFYIAREIQARSSNKRTVPYFMVIDEGYFFENASLLVSSPVEYGDLLTAINLYKANQGKPMSDFLALYFTVQILEIIESLHSFRIIHGDIKPDNFLVKKLNGKLALELIDFGRSIDMTLFPAGTSFTRVVTTEGFTCVEMQTGRSWTYQLDLYGVAGCVHCLLFGDYMKVVQKAGVWEISKVIPRYLAKSGWKELFQGLLNIPSCTEQPDLAEMRSCLSQKLQSYGPQPDLIKLTNFLENR